MSEKARNSSVDSFANSLCVELDSSLPYETANEISFALSSGSQSLEDSCFLEPDTEENLQTAYKSAGKRFEMGTGLSNIKSDSFCIKPVSEMMHMKC